jgi:hypothetical protein
MSRIKTLFIVLTLSGACSMQGQTVHYKTLMDDPYAIKKLHVHLDPFYCDLWGTNIHMGWGARANFYVGRLGALHFEMRRAYLDMMQEDAKSDLLVPKRGFKPYFYMEPSLDLNFSDKTRDRSLKVTLSSSSYSSGGYTYTSERYIMVDGSQRKVYSLHGGLSFSHSAFDMSKGNVTLEDGSTEANFTAISATDTLTGGHGMMSTMVVAAGLSGKTITNLIISTDWGNRGNSMLSHWYLDFLFAPVVSFEDMKMGSAEYKVECANKKRIGWRFGWEFHKPNKTFMSYKMEFGSRPGFSGGKWSGGYLGFTVGFNLAFLGS